MAEQPYTQTAGSRGYLTNTGTVPQPLPTTPMVAPTLPLAPGAPTPTPTGTFTAPDPSQMASDPYYQFRLSQGLQGIQRGAARNGTLLTGGLQARLMGFGQDLASAEGDKIYKRAMDSYTTNRDTNQQNFGQSLGTFGAQQGAYHDAADAATTRADVTNANASSADVYRQQMEAYRAHLATMAAPGTLPPGRQHLPGDPGWA